MAAAPNWATHDAPMTEPARGGPATGAGQHANADDEMTIALLRIAFPEFWFGRLTHRRQLARWVAVCKDDASRGLYMVAAADPDALTAALLCDQAWQSAYGGAGSTALERGHPTYLLVANAITGRIEARQLTQ